MKHVTMVLHRVQDGDLGVVVPGHHIRWIACRARTGGTPAVTSRASTYGDGAAEGRAAALMEQKVHLLEVVGPP